MADFNTHLVGAACVSGVVATGLMLVGVVPEQEVITYFVLGTAGGLLPDIDSESSIPFRVTFNVLAVLGGFIVVLSLGRSYSLAELLIVWTVCFAGVRYGVCSAFSELTVHRGLIHSIPGAIISGQLTVLLFYYLFDTGPAEAWMCGFFVFTGFIVHLLLDEAYSVDLMGAEFKRSFGSAFNLGSLDNPFATVALYLAIFALLILGPRPEPFIASLTNADYSDFLHRLLPAGRWFQGIFADLAASLPFR